MTLSCACAMCATPSGGGTARRRFLSGMAAGAALAALGAGSRAAWAQTAMTPDAAVDALLQGNARYVAGKLSSFDEDLAILKAHNVAGQQPFASVLSCADSRVPVELAFDQSIGHVFVARVAGNICTPEIIASLEYGAAVLGTAAILVMGHSGCGAVKAAIGAKAVPGQISALYAPLRPAVERAGTDLVAAVKANAQIQAEILRTASPVIAGLVAQSKLKVVAGYYDLASGQVSLLT